MKRLTEENLKDMNEMFENGLSRNEIMDLTGLSGPTVSKYKKVWSDGRKTKSTAEIEKKTEEPKDITGPGLENSDYAKSYLAGDPAVIRTSFDINRMIRIKSKKTGILYEMDAGSKDQVMKITLADGTEINIQLDVFEKFVDEGIDVYLEMKRTA